MQLITLIAAMADNRVIGKGASIPFRAIGEQKIFKDITMGGVLIMGRKTFESIGRPLPGRTTIVITRNPDFDAGGCLLASTLKDAIRQASAMDKAIFIAGGGEIYHQALTAQLDVIDGIHLTVVHTAADGDVYFPQIPADVFSLESQTRYSTNLDYTYQYYCRKAQDINNGESI